MMRKNNNIIKFIIIGILSLIILISGCIESDKEEYKPAIEEPKEKSPKKRNPPTIKGLSRFCKTIHIRGTCVNSRLWSMMQLADKNRIPYPLNPLKMLSKGIRG